MATKVTILGQADEVKEKKPIEFVFATSGSKSLHGFAPATVTPNSYQNVELICKGNSGNYYDIMFAYDENRSVGTLYLGHFNDGIVNP